MRAPAFVPVAPRMLTVFRVMEHTGRAWWLAVLCCLAMPALARSGPWETLSRGDIVVRVRAVDDGNARELWAEGELDAEVQDLQAAILDAESYPRFMPYVRESRRLQEGRDGVALVYTRVAPPFIQPRDYIVGVVVQKRVAPDGSGEFSNRWYAVPDGAPRRDSVVRLQRCEGTWRVVPGGDGRSRVQYRASVDPGGWVPEFISDMANRAATLDTFRALEAEARRRGEERRSQALNEAQRQARGRSRR